MYVLFSMKFLNFIVTNVGWLAHYSISFDLSVVKDTDASSITVTVLGAMLFYYLIMK